MARCCPSQVEFGVKSVAASGPRSLAFRHYARLRAIAGRLRRSLCFPFSAAKLVAICGLSFVCWFPEVCFAEDVDFRVYARAAEHCRGVEQRPMALDDDKRILCFDGLIPDEQDISLANGLQEGGLFVVRSPGGDSKSAILLADLLRDKRAIIVVYDYCISACASFLAMASAETYVLKNSIVAWHLTPSPHYCAVPVVARDGGPKRIEKWPCSDARYGGEYVEDWDGFFYRSRGFDPQFQGPPQSFFVRRILKGLLDWTGVLPEVVWTLNPKYYASIKTKIFYEAYPKSQEEVDAVYIFGGRIIYDP